MKRSVLSLLFVAATFLSAQAQVQPAYALFNAKGKPVSHKAWMKQVKAADVVLFGNARVGRCRRSGDGCGDDRAR